MTTHNKRKTIGLFTTRIGRLWGLEFMAGVLDAAAENDVNLILFVGGKPSATILPGSLKPSYGLYDLAGSDNISGLIFAADIAYGMSRDEVKRMRENYPDVPVVGNAIEGADIPNLVVDSYKGMREVIRHLIVEHGYKRIAFIKGLKGQGEAELRYKAYCDELKENNIKLVEKLVVQGDYSQESGRTAARSLLDSGIQFEAIAAANDRMAFGALETLQARGLHVPEDVAITGFDDIAENQSLGVPLTTVRQPFYTIGKRSVQNLLEQINGKTCEPEIILPTELIVRWSCGCLPESVNNAAVSAKEVARTGRLENKRDAAVNALIAATRVSEKEQASEVLAEIFTRTWDTFLANLRGEASSDAFLRSIEEVVKNLQAFNIDAPLWHNVVSTMRRYALASITDQGLALKTENLVHQARMLVSELAQRAQAYRRLQLEQQEDLLQGFSFSMAPAMSLAEIGSAINKNFSALGLDHFYIMEYYGAGKPDPDADVPELMYRLMLQYDDGKLKIPNERPLIEGNTIIPASKLPSDRRYTAVVMPLTLADNRFGFMWAEMGPSDWEVYTRVRNLISSALLRATLVTQREQARQEIERLLDETKQHAAENAQLYQAEQERRHMAEALVQIGRQLSSILKLDEVPRQILQHLDQVIPYERGALFLEEVGVLRLMAHHGFPEDERVRTLAVDISKGGVYQQIKKTGEALIIDDVTQSEGWIQVDWLPLHYSWIGVPLFMKNRVAGMLSLTRKERNAFSKDDVLVASTYSMQAAIAIENARLYDESTRFNELMERMVSQRVEELNSAYTTLEKLDKNKSSFINVAAHELRTPITVIKGYLGMIRGNPAVQADPGLVMAVDGVMTGTDRLHQIVNSMLDVARLDNQVLNVRYEAVDLFSALKMIQGEYRNDLPERNITLTIDENIKTLPTLMADSQLLRKALDHVIVNGIKFTPDGGSVTVSGQAVTDERLGPCIEIRVADTGIGIDPENHKIIFEKLYQLGKVELHSSGRTKYKGGGPGLGLAIAAGIVKAHGGRIWVESPGHDEEKFPGSTFFIRLPLPKEKQA